jgi:hypothetical protein
MDRPQPPAGLNESIFARLVPAPEVWEWLEAEILAEDGSIYNEGHAHLLDADIRVMWASAAFSKKGRTVVGQAEQVAFRAGGWQKARMEQQMLDWFGEVPAFIITLAADYCAQCSVTEFCALVEHELYHIAQKLDQYGAPKFAQDGLPSLTLRGHDVEEFVGVARVPRCWRWSTLQRSLLKWANSTFRGPAEPVCSSPPDFDSTLTDVPLWQHSETR